MRIICRFVGIYKINFLLPIHFEKYMKILLYLCYSPAIRAKDLLLVQICLNIGVSSDVLSDSQFTPPADIFFLQTFLMLHYIDTVTFMFIKIAFIYDLAHALPLGFS